MLDNTIDISHHNTVSNIQKVKDAGIQLVFHKATQGLKYVDDQYAKRKPQFLAAGFKWGSYHFGTGADGSDQADHFLSVADRDHLLVLDLEPNRQGPSMTLAQAEEFVQYMKDVTGRYPGLYGGHTLREMLGSNRDSVLGKCWLWFARYGNAPVIPPLWDKWTFWQHTDGHDGPAPRSVPGIGPCDRDKFHGTQAEFDAFVADNTVM